jgi:hypothetical protein
MPQDQGWRWWNAVVRSGGSLPETAEKALELATPLSPEPDEVSQPAQQIAQNDVTRLAGTYHNGASRLEIFKSDHHLYGRTGAKDIELIKQSESSYGSAREFGETVDWRRLEDFALPGMSSASWDAEATNLRWPTC